MLLTLYNIITNIKADSVATDAINIMAHKRNAAID